MQFRLSTSLILVMLSGIAWQANLNADDSARETSLARYLPAGALGSLEVSGLGPIIERIEASDALKTYLSSPLYQEASKTDPVRKAIAGKAILEAQLGMTLWTIAKTYFGDQLILGVYPPAGGPQPDGVLLIQVKTANDLSKLLEKVVPLLALAGDSVALTDQADDSKTLTMKDGNRIVFKDRWVVASKNPELLSKTLANLAAPPTNSLESEPSWKLMAAQLGHQHTVNLWIDLAKIRQLQAKRIIPEKSDNPLASLLIGGFLEYAVSSPYAGLTLDVRENRFSLITSIAGKATDLDASHSTLILNPEQPQPPLNIEIPQQLGLFSLSRDFSKWYKAREQLLEPKLMPEFDKFETGLATFLPGKDFADDVLPLLTGRVAVVSAVQDYSFLDGKPGVQLPAFAVVIELTKPSEGADILNLVMQTILTVSNLEAAKQNRQLWVQSSESYHEVQINFARYLKRPKGEQLPTAYNFQPASALVGNRFILSSSLGLCRNLIDAQKPERQQVPQTAADRLPNVVNVLSPSIAAQLLEANAGVLNAKSIQSGKTAEQSTQELNALCEFLRQLTAVHLETVQYPDRMQLELTGGWK